MLFVRASQAFLLMAALLVTPSFASRIHRAATSGHSHSRSVHTRRSRRSRARRARGQRSIEPARATQIQAALIQQHYLTGTPSGHWDAETEAAMQKYQADHGWQTKLMPDSRALISLGLGPDPQKGVQVAAGASPTPAGGSTPLPNTLASVHLIAP